MSSLLSLYFLHPFSNRLANKTQRFYSRYELTNPTKTPPPPFVFSLLSVILLHLHYTLQSRSPSVTTLCSFVTLSLIPLLLSPVPLLLCLLFPCYYPLFLCYSVSSSSVTTPCSFVTLSPFTLSPYTLSCKECLPVLSTGAFSLSKARPFKHAEHAFLAP